MILVLLLYINAFKILKKFFLFVELRENTRSSTCDLAVAIDSADAVVRFSTKNNHRLLLGNYFHTFSPFFIFGISFVFLFLAVFIRYHRVNKKPILHGVIEK